MSGSRILTAAIAASAIALSGSSVRAASDTWVGNTSADWSGSNWSGGNNPPLTGDALVFDVAGTSGTTLNNGLSGFTFAGITFNSGAPAYTIGGNAFTLSGALTNNSSSLQTFSNNITFAAAQTVTGAGDISLSGNLGGAGTSLTKSGAGTLAFSGTNSPTGNLLLSAGRLNITGGTTNFGGAFSNLGLTASTTGVVNVSSGATFGLTGANGGNLGSASGASGVLYNSGTFNQSATTVNNAGIYVGNAANTYGYLRNGTGATTTVGGRLWIAQAGNAAGAAGVLDITGGAVSVNSTGNFTANARLQINGDGNTHATSTSYAGVNIVNGTLTVGGNAAQTNINTGQNEYTSINITGTGKWTAGNSGTDSGIGLSVTNIATNTATLSISNGGTLETSYIYNSNALGKGTITFDNGTIRSLFNNATGIIQGTNTKTYIQSGGVTFDTNGFATTVQNPLLAPTGNGVTSIALGGTATGYVGAPVVKITGDGVGAAAIANFDPTTGTVTGITVTSPGSGYTTMTVTLVGGNGGSTGAGVGTATATATLGAVTSGGLTKTGTGTLTLSAANTYTGATTISAGTLKLASTGSLTSTTFSIAAGASLDASSKTGYSLSGQTITLSLDASSIGVFNTGTVALDLGSSALTLNVTTATPGASYDLLTSSVSTTGTLGTVTLGGLFSGSLSNSGGVWTGSSNGYSFSLDQVTGALSITAVPEPREFAIAVVALLGVMVIARRRQASRFE